MIYSTNAKIVQNPQVNQCDTPHQKLNNQIQIVILVDGGKLLTKSAPIYDQNFPESGHIGNITLT